MRRRSFLSWQLKGALWLAGGATLGNSSLLFAATPDVAVAEGGPGPAARAAVELLGGMKRFVKPGQRVVIKPNMSFAQQPEMATNTHPQVVSELVAMCKEAGAASILVLDNPLNQAEACMEQSGIKQACSAIQRDTVFQVTERSLYAKAELPSALEMKTAEFIRGALAADVLIAAPVAKSHSSTGVSLSMKGMMGLIWDRRIMHSTYSLDNSIVDLCTKLKAHLAVIDATRVLTTNGPGGPGKVITPNTVIASADMVAADAFTVANFEWYGRKMEPRQVKHIRLAHERGLGRMDIENLQTARVKV